MYSHRTLNFGFLIPSPRPSPGAGRRKTPIFFDLPLETGHIFRGKRIGQVGSVTMPNVEYSVKRADKPAKPLI